MTTTDARISGKLVFFSHFLVFLAAWTLTIKYFFPFAMAYSEQQPLLTYVMWDFWWVAHLALAYYLVHWHRFTYAFAMVTAVVEIVIVVTKFCLFLPAPTWDIWRTNWFINKIFVLLCFVLMLHFLLMHRKELPKA